MRLINKLLFSKFVILPILINPLYASQEIQLQMEAILRTPSSMKSMCERAYTYNSSMGMSYYGYLSDQMRKNAMVNNNQMYNSYAAEANLFENYCPGSF